MTHPSSDEASHLAVLSCPFSREDASNSIFSGAGMLVSHTVDKINHGGEVSMPFKTCLLILILFLKCCALQNFLRSAIPITLGIRIADLNVKNSGPPSLPKSRVLQHLHGLRCPTPHPQSSVPLSIPSHKRFLVRRRFERASRPSSTSVPVLCIHRHAAVLQSRPSHS